MGYETKITPQYAPAGTATTKVTIATMVGNPGPPGVVDNAADVPIEDTGGYYAGDDVEAALQEAGQERNDTEIRHRLGI